MLGAGRKAAQHIERLASRFGPLDLINSVDELIRRSEQVMRNRIRECPNGVYYADGSIESDGYNFARQSCPTVRTHNGQNARETKGLV